MNIWKRFKQMIRAPQPIVGQVEQASGGMITVCVPDIAHVVSRVVVTGAQAAVSDYVLIQPDTGSILQTLPAITSYSEVEI